MDTNFYDVVVCGGETTGLVAAALLARRGLRVLLLGHEPAHAGFDAWGATLSRAPALLPPIDETPVSRVFRELDSVALLKRRASPARGPLRVVLPGGHLDVLSDSVAFERELGRAYGSAGPRVAAAADRLGGVARLLDPLLASAIALPPNGFWERREVGRLESLLPRPRTDLYAPLDVDHPFRIAGAALAAASTALAPHELGAGGGSPRFRNRPPRNARLRRRPGRDFTTFCWPASKPSAAIGANVSPLWRSSCAGGARWASACCRATRPSGVITSSGQGRPPRWSPPSGRTRRPLRNVGAVPCASPGYRHALSLLCPTPFLPDGTPPRLLAVGDPSRPMTEDNALAITVGVPSTRVPERVPLWLECVVPPHALDGGAGYLRALRARLVHTLGRVLPALEGKLALVASAYDGLPPEGPDAAGVSANKPIAIAAPPPGVRPAGA